jgi:hypothetical protein
VKEAIVKALVIPLLQAFIWGSIAYLAWFCFVSFTASGDPRTAVFPGLFVFAVAYGAGINTYNNSLGVKHPLPVNHHHNLDLVSVTTASGHEGFFMSLPFDQDKFNQVCRYIVKHDYEFSQALLGGRGKIMSRPDFETLRTQMVSRGLARWVSGYSHNQSTELTPSGRAIVRRYAGMADDARTHTRTRVKM